VGIHLPITALEDKVKIERDGGGGRKVKRGGLCSERDRLNVRMLVEEVSEKHSVSIRRAKRIAHQNSGTSMKKERRKGEGGSGKTFGSKESAIKPNPLKLLLSPGEEHPRLHKSDSWRK